MAASLTTTNSRPLLVRAAFDRSTNASRRSVMRSQQACGERPDDDAALTLWCKASDQVRVQFGEYEVGEVVEQPHGELHIARHADALEAGLAA